MERLLSFSRASTNSVGGGQYSHSYVYDRLGNATTFANTSHGYSDPAHKQAVTHVTGVQKFWYDANGNPSAWLRASMTKRIEGAVTYDPQVYNVQNRLVSVTKVGSGTTTFTYDANGIRVKTVHPGGKTSYFPLRQAQGRLFPGYEEEVNGSTTTRRVTYAIAGQTVALRVQVVGGSSILYYLHSDHLGSTSLATTTAGAVVSGSTTRYHPFGGFRTTPTAGLTDIGYTGHRHNNINAGAENIGLIYMQARWYVPGVGRFLSADVLVPDPTNPQQFNRYSYVLNNALRYSDPTGHVCYDHTAGPELLGTCVNEDGSTYSLLTPLPDLILFDGGGWTAAEMSVVNDGARQIALMLYKASGGQFSSPHQAFMAVYGGSVTFYKTGTECAEGCYGRWSGNNTINVYDDIYKNGISRIPGENTGAKWAVHELGHGFEAKVNTILGTNHIRNNLPTNIANRDGFAGPFPGWQQSKCTIDCNGEIFADMFIGWAYGQWETNPFTGALTNDATLKADFMTTNMSVWIDSATRP